MKKNLGFVKRMITMTLAAAITTVTLATSAFASCGKVIDPATACTPTVTVASAPASSSQTSGDMYTVSGTSNYLALRNACAYDRNNEIGRIFNGDTVQLVDSSCGYTGYWYVYSPTLGMYGYVNKSYLVGSSAPAQTTSTRYTVFGTTNYLALRNAAAYDRNNEIGRIFNGDTVELVDSSCGYTGYWYVYSPTLGMYGYVNKSYLC